jgi:hypothetical protein
LLDETEAGTEIQDPEVAGEGAPSLIQVVEGPQPTPTVADILRRAYEDAQANRTPKDITIPGWGEPVSELHVTFHMVDDYEDLRRGIVKTINRKGLRPGQRDVRVAMETLKVAALGSYALVKGEKHDLSEPLGLALYDALGGPGAIGDARPTNDSQAIFMLFHQSTTMIMGAFTELDMWIKRGGRDAEEEALGE